ncbi:MAG: Sulfurtransferase [Thermodesulfobacteriota bacterium]|nr:Sulfurtransferase [Thermodesulfobacteriota bacterium]
MMRFPGGNATLRRVSLAVGAIMATLAVAAVAHAIENGGYPRSEFLVSTKWLAEHMNDPNVRILDRQDIEPEDGFYGEGHIPNSIRMTTDAIKGMRLGVQEMLVVKDLIGFLETNGIAADEHVVIVGRSDRLPATTRVFWALELLGHKKVSLLDGGTDKWLVEQRPWTKEVKTYPKTTYKVDLQRIRLVTGDELAGWVGSFKDLNIVVVDSRRPDEFAGEKMSRASQKLGRIPGAVNLVFPKMLTGDKYLEFKSAEEIKKIFDSLGVTPDKNAFFTCVSGCFGTVVYFGARLLDFPKAAVYDGAWIEWSQKQFPVEGAAKPGVSGAQESQPPAKAEPAAKPPARPQRGC